MSKGTVSRIFDRVVEEMQAWWARSLERVYAVIFIDAIMVKVRVGQVRDRSFYAVIDVDLNARCRRAVRARGRFPNERAALKVLYLVTRGLDPKGTPVRHDGSRAGSPRWTRPPPSFADRMPAAEDH